MQLIDGKLVMGRKDCPACRYYASGQGRMYATKTCGVCRGTGRGARGKERGCRNCSGYGTVTDFDRTVWCAVCKGNFRDFDPENYTDYAPQEIVDALPLRVERDRARHMSLIERYLGSGLGSCQDYGRAWAMADDEVLAMVRGDSFHMRHVQACKLVRSRDDLTLCDGLVVALTPQGYSIMPEWRKACA